MNNSFLTRNSLLWLLAAQIAVIAPRLDILPFWTALVWIVVAYWYWRIYRGDWHFPRRSLTWGLSLIAVVGIALEYRTALALEPQVALLITAFILKLLELKSVRDHWLLLMLSYFIVACGFVFDTSMLTVVIAIGQLLVLLMAQQSLFRPRTELKPMLGSTFKVFGQSIPLMLVIFVVFPRFGPLWSVPLPGDSAKTGISDHMAPGDVSKLSRSSELAFRVTFEGDIPPQRDLYWRGIVLEKFDGRTWTRDTYGRRYPESQPPPADAIAYEVILEHGVHEWLLAIPRAYIQRDDVRQDQHYQWLPRSALTGRLRYEVKSDLDAPRDRSLDQYTRFKNLYLPGNVNARARALAREWRDLPDEQSRLAAARAFFRERPFVYTLEPPKLGENSVDEFLYQSRRGYCEHYASSLVFLMRAAGVPSRVVVGYQGGERNPAGNYLLVHQSDAHAWAEVWLGDEGWERVDPTGWVAPDRIELGADIALADEPGFLADDPVSLRRWGGVALIGRFRLLLDQLEYQWVRWVVNFDTERQWELISNLLGDADRRKLAIALIIALAVPMILAGLLTIRLPERRRLDPAVRWYLDCCRALQKLGIARGRGEAPRDFYRRVAREAPSMARWFKAVTDTFYQAQYQPLNEPARERAVEELKRLRRTAPSSRSRRRA